MARVILDSGAVIALSRQSPRVRAFLARALHRGDFITIPAIVVAEVVRGTARDAPVNRVLKAVSEITPVDERTARTAGSLLGASQLRATVDAVVLASALLERPSVVLTGDVDDLRTLLGAHPGVWVQDVNDV